MTAGIQKDLLSPEVAAEVRARVGRMVAKPRELAPSNAKRIAALNSEVANLVDAIASGAPRTSPALAVRLQIAEDDLARLNY